MNTKLPAPSLADTKLIDENGGKAVATRTTGPSNTFLVPTNMADAMRLAELMAGSLLIPRDFQKKPSDCLMVIMQAVRWQMDPFAIIQKCSVIRGKLMYEGQLVAAVVNARGNLKQRLSFAHFGEGKERGVTVSGQFHGEEEPREVEVTLASAKTSAEVWDKQPDQQLCYHGARKWARLHMPELMLGVYSPEEMDDVKADAERDIANGISVHHPDDYSEGTPERLTNPPAPLPPLEERPRFQKAAERWLEKVEAWKAQMDECTTVDQLEAWGRDHHVIVLNAPSIHKLNIYSYFETTKENLREAELADQVVHDSDDMEPRPASVADFYDDESGGELVDNNTPQTTGGTPVSPHPPAAARVPPEERAAQAFPARVPYQQKVRP